MRVLGPRVRGSSEIEEELTDSVRKMEIQVHRKPIRSGENGLQEDFDIVDPLIGAQFKYAPINGLLMGSVGLQNSPLGYGYSQDHGLGGRTSGRKGRVS